MKLFSQYRGLRRELYILFIGRIMTNLGSMVWPMLTMILSMKLGFSATKISLAMMAYGLIGMPMTLLGGKLADRFNKKNIIVLCDLFSIVGYIVCFFRPLDFVSILIFAASSLFQSIEWAAYDTLVSDFTATKDRERAYSLSYLGTNIGMVLAPTLGGLLFKEHLNLAFLINGLAIASSTVLIALLIHNVEKEEDTSDEAEYQRDMEDNASALKFIWGSRVILLYILANTVYQCIYGMYNYLMPLDLGRVFGEESSVLFGTMSSINCIVVITCTTFITRFFRKTVEAKKLFIADCLVLSGYVLFLLLMKRVFFCYVAIVVFTLGEIFQAISGASFLSKRIPASHRGRITSVSSVFSTSIYGLFYFAAGLVYDNFGSTMAWGMVLASGGILLFLAFSVILFDRKDYPGLQKKNAEE